MLSGTPLFHLAIQNPPNEALYQITKVLAELPPGWGLAQSNDKGDSGPHGSEDPVDLSPQIAKFPLDLLVKDIEAERISLPTVNVGVKGKNPRSKAWKKEPASRKFRAHIKNNSDIYWKPFPSARYAGIDETEGSHRQIEIEEAMSEKMARLPKITTEESASLTDLLSRILRYQPAQRISLEDLAQHPWLTANESESRVQYAL